MDLVALRHVGSSWIRDQPHVFRTGRRVSLPWATREALLFNLKKKIFPQYFLHHRLSPSQPNFLKKSSLSAPPTLLFFSLLIPLSIKHYEPDHSSLFLNSDIIYPFKVYNSVVFSMYVHAKLLQSCPALCNPVDCSPLGFSVHGILQARRVEWVSMPSSRGFVVYSQMYWRRQWHPTPVLLPGKSHGWRSLVGCSPWGR